MKTILTLLFLTFSSQIWATGSSFPSSVKGLSIANSHELISGIYRGSEPGKKVQELSDFGVDEVIIFKSQTKTEVDDELLALKELGIRSHHIPFKWKELENYEEACGQVVAALSLIRRAQTRNKTVFFHCTVGEDRTGLLAGLVRMEFEGLTGEEAWEQEMCPRGYADGNAKKPSLVTSAIHQGLTPLFWALAQKMEAGEKLTKKSCLSLALATQKRRCR